MARSQFSAIVGSKYAKSRMAERARLKKAGLPYPELDPRLKEWDKLKRTTGIVMEKTLPRETEAELVGVAYGRLKTDDVLDALSKSGLDATWFAGKCKTLAEKHGHKGLQTALKLIQRFMMHSEGLEATRDNIAEQANLRELELKRARLLEAFKQATGVDLEEIGGPEGVVQGVHSERAENLAPAGGDAHTLPGPAESGDLA